MTTIKDPNANLDYTWDWTKWLAATSDTIASVVWVVDNELTEGLKSNTTLTATIWLSGGTAGKSYAVTCRITTAAGRIDDYTRMIKMQDK